MDLVTLGWYRQREGAIALVASRQRVPSVLRYSESVWLPWETITPGFQSSQMYWLFAEQFHFQSMYRLHSFTDGKQLSLLKSRHCFDIKHTCHLILPRTHPQTIKKQIPNKIYNTKTTFMSMSNGSCPSKRQIKTLLMQVPSEAR